MNYFERRRNEIYKQYGNYSSDNYIESIVSENWYDDEYDYVSEGVGDMISSMKEKLNNLWKKIKELWDKFKAWIKNLFNVVVNMFKSGKKLMNQYGSEIREGFKKKGNAITFTGYIYSVKGLANMSVLDSDLVQKSLDKPGVTPDNAEEAIAKTLLQEFKLPGETLADLKKNAPLLIRDAESKQHKLSDINYADFEVFLTEGKDLIKALKQVEKDMNAQFKGVLDEIKTAMSELDRNTEEGKAMYEEASKGAVLLKKVAATLSSVIKSLIKETKAAIRLYTSLARKILDNRVKGTDNNNDDEERRVLPRDMKAKDAPWAKAEEAYYFGDIEGYNDEYEYWDDEL